MNLGRPVRSIGILGGGSAGCLAALYLKKMLPEVQVSLTESSRIPVIGVGEASTPLLVDVLHRKLGYSMGEFFQEAKPTLKLGIRFDWGKQGSYHFNTAFGRVELEKSICNTGDANNLSFGSMLMEQNKVPFVRNGEQIVSLLEKGRFAYHIDNKRFLRYLKGKLFESGCGYIDAEIAEVRLSSDGLGVQHLRDTCGLEYQYDLYVDCTGFRSQLLSQSLRVGWVDYSSSLQTNRAVVGTRSNAGEIPPYTTSATMKHGWLWTTPMQEEDHLGYVFSAEHSSDDEALQELEEHTNLVDHARVIQFKPGRRASSWQGNVVGIGNSFAFIEPLESTGLHMILRQLRELKHRLQHPTNLDEIESYNHVVNTAWDRLRWFVAMHFKLNRRLDTPFWRDCRETVNLDGLREYMDFAKQHGPLSSFEASPLHAELEFDNFFSVFAHDAVLTGCGWNDHFFAGRRAELSDEWLRLFARQRLLRGQCIGQREALRYLAKHGNPYLPTAR